MEPNISDSWLEREQYGLGLGHSVYVYCDKQLLRSNILQNKQIMA